MSGTWFVSLSPLTLSLSKGATGHQPYNARLWRGAASLLAPAAAPD